MAKTKKEALLNRQIDDYCDRRDRKWNKLVTKMKKAGLTVEEIEDEQLYFNAVTHHYCYTKIKKAGFEPSFGDYETYWE